MHFQSKCLSRGADIPASIHLLYLHTASLRAVLEGTSLRKFRWSEPGPDWRGGGAGGGGRGGRGEGGGGGGGEGGRGDGYERPNRE